jgi:Na+/H+ antiporter NhaD/arsenite permease-like protein
MLAAMDATTTLAVTVFAVVYLGMILGGLPYLHLDRTGVALLGAIALIGFEVLTVEEAARAIHLPTLLLLFSFMVVSAQLRLGGFYARVTQAIVALQAGPGALLAAVVVVVALLSAVFSNDIVCLAVAPVLAHACVQRRLDPVPYLLALACAANIGSAATLIGNPQNMLIGQTLALPFGAYTSEAALPVLLGLLALWLLLLPVVGRAHALARRRADAADHAGRHVDGAAQAAMAADTPAFDAWQSAKGLLVAGVLVGVFLFTDGRHEVAALIGAGVLLLSQRFHSSRVMGLIDWELLILFVGLFIVNHALARTGLPARAVQWLAAQGVPLGELLPLGVSTFVLSNLVSNVPAVMLLLPVADAPHGGTTLALVSTFAGNLLIVGSIANIIVVDAARRYGIDIDWKRHAAVGVPVTLVTLAITAAWLAWRASGG